MRGGSAGPADASALKFSRLDRHGDPTPEHHRGGRRALRCWPSGSRSPWARSTSRRRSTGCSALLEDGGSTATYAAERLAVSPPSVTAIVDGLVARVHGRRARTSRAIAARVHLELTDEGFAALDRGDKAIAAELEHVASHGGDRQASAAASDALAWWSDAIRSEYTSRGPLGDDQRHAVLAGHLEERLDPPYVPPAAPIDPDATRSAGGGGSSRWSGPTVGLHHSAGALLRQPDLPGPRPQPSQPGHQRHGRRSGALARELRDAMVAVLGVLAGITGFGSRWLLFRTAYDFEYDLRNLIFEHLTRLSAAFYDRTQSGQLISRANSDIRSVQMYATFAP